MKKQISQIYLLLFLLISSSLYISSYKLSPNIFQSLKDNENPIKIMCVGDSITDGFGVAGSYRKFLYHGLTKKGYKVDMVGSKGGYNAIYTNETSGETFEYDDENTGYSTYTIKSYAGRNGIYETLVETNCLSEKKPDIVILQIGTNNIIDNHDEDENKKDLESLIDYILENIPSTSTLFITTIPGLDPNREDVYTWFANYRHSADWQTNYPDPIVKMKVDAALQEYNSDLTLIANKRKESGQNVRPADVFSAITDVSTQLKDGVHPNDYGYRLMGDYWTEIIDKYLKGESDSPSPSNSSYKPTSISTVSIPKGIIYDSHAIYSKSGNILLTYKKENDNNLYIGVMGEDGSNLKELWGGEWKALYQSNGVRLMPFDDNKKILTGDYVLECSPNIDECESSKLLPVIYPNESVNLPGVYFVWSEIVVSPDEHIAWSTLSSIYENVNFLGQLKRNENNYTITNVQIISTLGLIEYEDEKKGIFKKTPIRGGEIKQFTNGGEALTLAGAGNSALAKSVFQNLVGDENFPLTNFPGYEETTIISPDGQLGLVMTTRFSPKTSSEILGFLPRPLAMLTAGKMNRYAYMYGVAKVRTEREGNIGPAVININQSMLNTSYLGYDLHEDIWVFCSPMSWHPSSKKAMFTEINRITQKKRIRIVYFADYKPLKTLENKKTPDNIPYAKKLEDLKEPLKKEINGYFVGKEGILIFNKTETICRTEYKNYSEDGKTFFNGVEESEYLKNQFIGRLTSNVVMTGEQTGKMNLSIYMNYNGDIIYEENGKEISYGYVEYNGKKLTIENSYSKE